MYRKIMVPVDLAHVEKLGKAITTATDLARHYGIPICFVGVTAQTPSEAAHTPMEFASKLNEFGARESAKHGLKIDTAAYSSHDPAVDLDEKLIAAAKENEADLIVMPHTCRAYGSTSSPRTPAPSPRTPKCPSS